MIRTRRLVFWQNMASHHQFGVMKALVQDCGFKVVWVVEQSMQEDRAAMGWPEFKGDELELVVDPDDEKIAELMSEDPEGSLHFVGGIFGVKLARKVFFTGVRQGLRFAFMNEVAVPQSVEIAGKTRMNRYFGNMIPFFQKVVRWLFEDAVRAVLCIGGMAEQAYTSYGWGEKVFPYGYFPPGPGDCFDVLMPEGDFKIVYLGQFTNRKGTDVLVKALAQIGVDGWSASLFGEGEQLAECKQIVEDSEFAGKVSLVGFAAWEEAMRLVAESDLVVVPSRHDGWGAVVGEALMRGVPVVTTDHTGSSVLLNADWRGSVVPAGDVSALAGALEGWIRRGRMSREERKRIAAWGLWLEPQSAATYVLGIVNWIGGGPRPITPWHRS